jgi:hypothetical protein
VNATTIRCTTPATDEAPDSIYRETVTVSVAMNGQDFQEDSSEVEFTFVGTAPYISFLAILLTLVAIGFVAFAVGLWSIQDTRAAFSAGGGGGGFVNRGGNQAMRADAINQ